MCNIEGMFHQIHVNPEQRNFLRFLWCKNGRIDTEPTEYRMTVHLFGATSSLAHWTKKWIYIIFAQRKAVANISLLQSKPVANVLKSTFATIFTLMCKYDSKCGLYHVCYRFALEQRYVCSTFALCKFNVNPFFRPV